MISARRIAASLLLGFLGTVAVSAKDQTASNRLVTTRRVPNAFGTDSYNVTTISATAFYPGNYYDVYETSGSLGRYGNEQVVTEFYATLDLPGGAVIDYIGLNSLTDTDFVYGISLINRHKDGGSTPIASLSSTVHGWDTDFNASPIGYVWEGRTGDGLVINVEEGSNPNFQYFGWVEVWWKRSVSPPPATPSFNDVPASHPFFQYIEALKASGVTGGCSASPPLYCPDSPLTRGQMAVFLSKALGLHWPGQPSTFGTSDYTVTTIPAIAFYPGGTFLRAYDTYPDFGRTSLQVYYYTDFYDSLDLPGGAVIDYIGLNSFTDTDATLGVELVQRHKDGGLASFGTFSSTVHGWDTDFNASPIGYVWQGKTGDALIVHVQQAPNPNLEFFGWVEIWWRRSVSPAPATASFNDVPTSHPFFQYIEALKASGITGGCSASPPLYCPGNALTRGQMAVFLAKALGLHWPGN